MSLRRLARTSTGGAAAEPSLSNGGDPEVVKAGAKRRGRPKKATDSKQETKELEEADNLAASSFANFFKLSTTNIPTMQMPVWLRTAGALALCLLAFGTICRTMAPSVSESITPVIVPFMPRKTVTVTASCTTATTPTPSSTCARPNQLCPNLLKWAVFPKYYNMLSCNRTLPPQELEIYIKKSCQRFKKEWHPDRFFSSSPSQEEHEIHDEIYIAILRACQVMEDPELREEYDEDGELDYTNRHAEGETFMQELRKFWKTHKHVAFDHVPFITCGL